MSELFTGMMKNEPAEAYHSKREYVSSSPLPEMKKSPLSFYHKWTTETVSTDPMDRGNFMHGLLLEQEISKFVARPLNDKGELVRSNTKDYAAWLANQQGKTPIHPDLFNDAMSILTSACNHSKFMTALGSSDVEVSFYGKHAETGLYIKARPDVIDRDRRFILDVKSTSDITRFEGQIFRLAYDIRLIHYLETIKAVEGVTIPEVYFFAIEQSAPFVNRMFRLTSSAREAAQIQWSVWMNEIAACKAEGKWYGMADDIVDVDRPAYLEVEEVSFEAVG